MLKRVLVANRGEIAVRVIRACHELGLEAVAVYSDADQNGLPVRLADAAYRLGPAPAAQSYLNAERIVAVARQANCDAIHPGYGLLSENAAFAARVEAAGLIFIGPSPEAIRLMGDKLAARVMAREQGVPTISGAFEAIPNLKAARRLAKQIGYPVLIKAAAGGGGKGMRVVRHPDELANAYEHAASEVAQSFSDSSIYLEKFIARAKHIEIQILSYSRGDTVHLYERDCSVQRRHQKLIEESPAPQLSPAMREEMGRAAVEIARACGYHSAGTVEFLYDVQEDRYYFLEMNTRIQVEHPVTELVTGIDLVQQQLRIASDEALPLSQEQVQTRGAAIECRIYAEDSEQGFLPSIGRIEELILPAGPGVRVDQGIDRGEQVSAYYDSLLLKLIVWAQDRLRAIARMRRALEELFIVGVPTTAAFHLRALHAKNFIDGSYTTDFVNELGLPKPPSKELLQKLAVAAVLKRETEFELARAETRNEAAWKRAVWPEKTDTQ
jgi:acetyl-CoA carboxylase biotin carboxylase subunit